MNNPRWWGYSPSHGAFKSSHPCFTKAQPSPRIAKIQNDGRWARLSTHLAGLAMEMNMCNQWNQLVQYLDSLSLSLFSLVPLALLDPT